MWSQASSRPAHKWWFEFAKAAPELRYFTTRVLNINIASSPIERVWSIYDFIHSQKRNKLTKKRAQMLVRIFTNRALRRKMRRLATKNATDPAIPWAWFPMEEEEEDQLVDQDEAEAMLIDLEEEEEEEDE